MKPIEKKIIKEVVLSRKICDRFINIHTGTKLGTIWTFRIYDDKTYSFAGCTILTEHNHFHQMCKIYSYIADKDTDHILRLIIFNDFDINCKLYKLCYE